MMNLSNNQYNCSGDEHLQKGERLARQVDF